MVDERNYFFLGGFFSFSIYFFVVFIVFIYISDNNDNVKQFRTQKENFLEINIVTQEKPKPQPIVETKKVEKTPEIKEEVKKEQSAEPTPPPKPSIQDLFGKINATTPTNTQEVRKPQTKKLELSHESLKKEKSVSKMVEQFDFQTNSPAINSSVGEYNEYYGKISEILNEKWRNTYSTIAGASAWVDIIIDSNGHLGYAMTKPSYNNDFNAMLLDFLDSLKDEVFPQPKDGKSVRLNVEFKETR